MNPPAVLDFAAIATTYRMLKTLGLKTRVPGAGELLSGKY